MAHFAKISPINGSQTEFAVVDVQCADEGWFDGQAEWVQTSYNTSGGVHKYGGVPLRKNYAGIGYTYDSVRDAFIPPKFYPSWVLNQDSCLWESPIAMPNDGGVYKWDEDVVNWVLVNP